MQCLVGSACCGLSQQLCWLFAVVCNVCWLGLLWAFTTALLVVCSCLQCLLAWLVLGFHNGFAGYLLLSAMFVGLACSGFPQHLCCLFTVVCNVSRFSLIWASTTALLVICCCLQCLLAWLVLCSTTSLLFVYCCLQCWWVFLFLGFHYIFVVCLPLSAMLVIFSCSGIPQQLFTVVLRGVNIVCRLGDGGHVPCSATLHV